MSHRCTIRFTLLVLGWLVVSATGQEPTGPIGKPTPRRPSDEAELKYWLENMVWYHGYSATEIAATTGMSAAEIQIALARWSIRPDTKPRRPVDPPLLVLPYPGGRHPRLGFFNGAIDPQRETKLSIFTPWDESSYVVLDVPEAIWSNLGLTYLAHTHIDTIWSKQQIQLPPREWQRRSDGSYSMQRQLPNGIEFGVEAEPHRDHVALRMWLKNGTAETLRGLRVQVCAMLGHAQGFTAQTRDNKVLQPPFAAARSADGQRWIVQAWQPIQRAWDNPPCPCIHADPQFPDCAPGQTQEVFGRFSFYTGSDIQGEFARISQSWRPLERVAVTGQIVDAESREPLPARLYIADSAGRNYFAESTAPGGSAVRYDKQNWVNPRAIERHTTLSAGPFRAWLPPGKYTLTVERGKEYEPTVQELEVTAAGTQVTLPLRRWIDLPKLGWYSGDTHLHRTLAELPNVVLAEDLHVAFPFTYWVTRAFTPPTEGDRTLATDAAQPAELRQVDSTHVIWPRNTEWEIFTIDGQRHTLGAIFALNHRTPFTAGIPPTRAIVEQARREGALFDMDKHDWPFALLLPPLLEQGLFELANNHVWRTEFGFTNWNTPAPDWMGLPHQGRQGSERDWLEYTHRTYWALLNAGFRWTPTAGTASGVHPVPAGFGRVYVQVPGSFSYDRWLAGLAAGNSFVTTGPMVFGQRTGHGITGTVRSRRPEVSVELIVNGRIVETFSLQLTPAHPGGYEAEFQRPVEVAGTHWVAIRVWESAPDAPGKDRWRFAHTAPWWRDVAGQPLRPRREEIQYFLDRATGELARSRNLLPPAAIQEYEQAVAEYRKRFPEP